ncbi:hypothetical protein [Actinomadura sp. NEAU-AAG7]|uniref:hypothetical protein n=1 Tax=Actinomadura sp. NEAU-AAG7 TaxID=2839640 RepID=UPI001BE44690|nr:hypothetical protein [Actinomadura sp. NEAU-AAG7]MBT2208739.1 hypothetical protein [Actinomadura sp. NEAU-AAG7]
MGALAVTFVLSATTFAVSSGTAHASALYFEDGFERDPMTTWEWDMEGDGSAGFEFAAGMARTGANNGWLTGRRGGASEKRWMDTAVIPRGAGAQCAAQIWVDAPYRTTVVLEMWTPSGGLRYSGTRTVNGGNYESVSTDRWPMFGEYKMQFRIVLHGSGGASEDWVRLDDLAVLCTW